MKRLAVIILLGALTSACDGRGSSRSSEAAGIEELGPNATAILIVKRLQDGDIEGLRALATGRVSELFDEIADLIADRDRLCDGLLVRLPESPEKERVRRLRRHEAKKLIWPAPETRLAGRIEVGDGTALYRLETRLSDASQRERVMFLEKDRGVWRLARFDDGPDLDAVVQIRNRFNRFTFVVDGALKRFAAAEPPELDAETLQLLAALESMFGVA